MTQAVNLANFANNLDSSGGLNPSALNAATPISKGGTGATTASAARTALGVAIGTDVPSLTGSGASGTWTINVTGNAATATTANALNSSLSYSSGAFTANTSSATTTITLADPGVPGLRFTNATANRWIRTNGSTIEFVNSSYSGVPFASLDNGDLVIQGNFTSTGGGVYGLNLFGQGQINRDVTGSRAFNTTYTNSTGRTIVVTVTQQQTVYLGNITAVVGGVLVAVSTVNTNLGYSSITFVVPNGYYYYSECPTGNSLAAWVEYS